MYIDPGSSSVEEMIQSTHTFPINVLQYVNEGCADCGISSSEYPHGMYDMNAMSRYLYETNSQSGPPAMNALLDRYECCTCAT